MKCSIVDSADLGNCQAHRHAAMMKRREKGALSPAKVSRDCLWLVSTDPVAGEEVGPELSGPEAQL